jgi:hypothetical protein
MYIFLIIKTKKLLNFINTEISRIWELRIENH